jgi:hypothetical protein
VHAFVDENTVRSIVVAATITDRRTPATWVVGEN